MPGKGGSCAAGVAPRPESDPAGEAQRGPRVMVLGLGNDLLGDDGIALLAVRRLGDRLAGRAAVRETAAHGLALLEILEGWDGAVLLDAVCSGTRPAGAVFEVPIESLDPIAAPSPHYAGVPEMLRIARSLGLRFPDRIRIVAMEVRDPWTVGAAPGPEVLAALPEFCDRAAAALEQILADPLPAA